MSDAVDQHAGDLAVGVSGQDDVHAGNLAGDRQRPVFIRHLAGRRLTVRKVLLEAHVHRDDDEVGALATLQDVHPALRFGDRLAEFEAGVVLPVLPRRNARRRQAQDADADAVQLLHDVGPVVGLGRAPFVGVRRQPRKARLAPGLFEHGQAEVVLVIADGHGVVGKGVHRQHHRIGRCVVGAVVHVLERRALDRVTRVEQQRARRSSRFAPRGQSTPPSPARGHPAVPV